jgi:CBS domain-containing protein
MRMWHVDDVMTPDVITVREDAPYREIVDTLIEARVSAVPVVDDDRRVVGVVSEADLLHKIELVDDDRERRIFVSRRQRDARSKAQGAVARDLMSSPAITVVARTTLPAAARMMDREQVKRLPVTDDLGRLIGIVTRSDLLQVYLRPDAAIRREVMEEVLGHTLWVEPGDVVVQVSGGVVTLTGSTDRWSTAQLAVKLTRYVAGVVDVTDRLDFRHDDRELVDSRNFGPDPIAARR